MICGNLVKVLTNTLLVYNGIKMAEDGVEKRWHHPIACVFYFVGVGIFQVLDFINTIFYYKHSPIAGVMLFAGTWIVVSVFYRMSFYDFIRRFLFYSIYASTVVIIEDIACYIASYNKNITYELYCNVIFDEKWHWSHLFIMIFTAIGSCLLQKYFIEKQMIQFIKKTDCLFCVLILELQFVMEQYVFSFSAVTEKPTSKYMIFILLYGWMLISMSIVFWVIRMLTQSEKEQLLSIVQLNSLKKEYHMMMEQYTAKRIQMHDIIYQDSVIIGYMRCGQYDLALQKFEKKLQGLKDGTMSRYTGIDAVDLILNYEINKAKNKNVEVNMTIDCFSCPMKEEEFCIIIGNLMDNAIEATEHVSADKRVIDIDIREPNDMFILKIRNPYDGKLKKHNGKYITTKTHDLDMHSLGLRSVERLLQMNNGTMEILDEDGVFSVDIFIYGK